MSEEKRGIALFINDIMECMEKVETYTHNMTFEQFVKDEKTKDAVIRNLEVIGEAVKNISDDVREAYPEVNWRAVAGMRDKLIHEYFGVSFPIVWETIQNDLPPFRCEIEKIADDLNRKTD